MRDSEKPPPKTQAPPYLPWFGGLALRTEAGYLPALFLEDAFSVARDLGYWGGGVQAFGPLGGAWGWTFGAGLFRLWENDGFWQAKDSPRDGAFYARPRSNLVTVAGGLTWQRPLHRRLTLVLAAELGLVFFTGDLKTSEVIPGCTGPLEQCGHWETEGTEGLGLPGAWLPLPGLQAGLRTPLPANLFLQWDLGWHGLPFCSLALGWRRPLSNRP